MPLIPTLEAYFSLALVADEFSSLCILCSDMVSTLGLWTIPYKWISVEIFIVLESNQLFIELIMPSILQDSFNFELFYLFITGKVEAFQFFDFCSFNDSSELLDSAILAISMATV